MEGLHPHDLSDTAGRLVAVLRHYRPRCPTGCRRPPTAARPVCVQSRPQASGSKRLCRCRKRYPSGCSASQHARLQNHSGTRAHPCTLRRRSRRLLAHQGRRRAGMGHRSTPHVRRPRVVELGIGSLGFFRVLPPTPRRRQVHTDLRAIRRRHDPVPRRAG